MLNLTNGTIVKDSNQKCVIEWELSRVFSDVNVFYEGMYLFIEYNSGAENSLNVTYEILDDMIDDYFWATEQNDRKQLVKKTFSFDKMYTPKKFVCQITVPESTRKVRVTIDGGSEEFPPLINVIGDPWIETN